MARKPALFILMRKDIASMNPGKGMAQATHAAQEFDEFMTKVYNQEGPPSIGQRHIDAFEEWKEDRAFGTTLVKNALLAEMTSIVDRWDMAGLTIDPTYPWQNYYGETFLSSEVTCAWVFSPGFMPDDPYLDIRALPLHA